MARFLIVLIFGAVIASITFVLELPARSSQCIWSSEERNDIQNASSESQGVILKKIEDVRASAGLISTVEPNALNRKLVLLLRWIVRDYVSNCELGLLSDLPEGVTAAGGSRRSAVLKKTFWLIDNAVYGAAALNQYVPALGRRLEVRWRHYWSISTKFRKMCPEDQYDYVIGVLPEWDAGRKVKDRICEIVPPGPWEKFRVAQYPDPAASGFNSLPLPIIGTDSSQLPSGHRDIVPIKKDNPRDLLKYGCLRQVLKGNFSEARDMFESAIDTWDGDGFRGPRSIKTGIYYTRDLAFSLLCASALGDGGALMFHGHNGRRVKKADIENRLWAMQSPTGGVWSAYCAGSDQGCVWGRPVRSAKETNEIAPLILLAYGRNIWRSR